MKKGPKKSGHKRRKPSAISELLTVMAKLRSPRGGCPWDLEQDHKTLRYYAVEEVYELLDAIEAGDDHEMAEELGDLLLQVVFHAQLAKERGAFDFEDVCRVLVEKLIRRHPHVFGLKSVKDAAAVLAQWDHIKRAEKKGTRHERSSALDGIPKHLPSLMRAQKLIKKARKAKLTVPDADTTHKFNKSELAARLFQLAAIAQQKGWAPEALLRQELRRREKIWRKEESRRRQTEA